MCIDGTGKFEEEQEDGYYFGSAFGKPTADESTFDKA
jgi:hypothetical protein